MKDRSRLNLKVNWIQAAFVIKVNAEMLVDF
jgi:hypothetical protein